jgi:DNA-binding PadR family transcriptional regulator
MSVRQALLALLEEGPMYGYQLRSEFERRTGATWPLNVGQVYTTLTRLERDGLVAQVAQAEGDGDGHVVYEVTEAGRDEVAAWFTTPVARTTPPRDELAIKLALAVTVPGVDVGTVIQQQRSATMAALQDYTRLKRDRTDATAGDLAWGLVLDSLVFGAEAEVRWLDHCEARLRRAAVERAAASGATPGAMPDADPASADAPERTAR